jgi:hypothetical protein
MLFDYVTKRAPSNGNTQTMLAKLQVPLLRVALRDKNFFTQRSHPARLLLNAVAETGMHWINASEGESDPALRKKIHTAIERLNNEFDGDLSLIERMLGDMSQHMQTLTRKAEVTERRLVNASKGREKLALARETAGNAIAERIPRRPGRSCARCRAGLPMCSPSRCCAGRNSESYRNDDRRRRPSSAFAQPRRCGAARTTGEESKPSHQIGYHKDIRRSSTVCCARQANDDVRVRGLNW